MKQRGFTLIELLVVISIIALLLSILMPSLSKAKETAKEVRCKFNIKQLCMGVRFFSDDNNGKTPATTTQVGPTGLQNQFWFHFMAPYMGDDRYQDDPDDNLDGPMRFLFCPSTKRVENPPYWDYGDAKTTWVWVGSQGSYGMNGWLYPESEYSLMRPSSDNGKFYPNFSAAPSHIPLVGDCTFIDSWPDEDDLPPPDLLIGETSSMGRYCIDRHRMGVNIGFVDGHSERVLLKKLWSLYWNKTFTTTSEMELPR